MKLLKQKKPQYIQNIKMRNRFIRNLLIVVVFTCTTFCAEAQQILTLEEAVATALQNNYDIQLARRDSLAAGINYQYRDAVFLPTLNAATTAQWNNNNQKQILANNTVREAKGVKSNNINGNANLNWVLFDGLRMFASREKAAYILEAGGYTAKQQIIATVATVIKTYYDIARQRQQIKLTDVQIELNAERAKLAQYKLDIGTGAKPDVLQSKVDLNAQRSLRLQYESEMVQLKQQLSQAMNLQNNADFNIPDTIPVNYSLTLSDVLQDLDRTNPSLLLAKANIDIANLTLKESKSEQYPTLSFFSNYNYNRLKNKRTLNDFSLLYNRSNGYNYGLTASIPIFNQFNIRKQIKQDKLNVTLQQLNFENQFSILNLSILNAFRAYEQQKQQLKLEEENILLARENFDIVNQTYRLGMATLIQLREAQSSLAQAYNRLIEARYNAKISETELMRLRGDIVK